MSNSPEVLAFLLGCVREEYTDEDGTMPGGEVVVAQPGQAMTADWCGQCGDAACAMLYVRLDTMVPSSAYPNPDRTAASVTAPLAASWQVGVLRGLHGMDPQGNPPEAADQITDAVKLLEDAERLLRAIRCCLRDHLNSKSTVLGAWQPSGPSGDCAGGYWTLTTRLL